MTPVAKLYTGKMAVSVISEGNIILLFITKNKIGVLQSNLNIFLFLLICPEAEFKEFDPRLKNGLFHLKSYSMFQDLSQRSIETGFWRIWDAAQIH